MENTGRRKRVCYYCLDSVEGAYDKVNTHEWELMPAIGPCDFQEALLCPSIPQPSEETT